jgi:hypothetical protein
MKHMKISKMAPSQLGGAPLDKIPTKSKGLLILLINAKLPII